MMSDWKQCESCAKRRKGAVEPQGLSLLLLRSALSIGDDQDVIFVDPKDPGAGTRIEGVDPTFFAAPSPMDGCR